MLKQMAKLLILGGALLTLAPAGWAQNMLPEGDFETPNIAPPGPAALPAGFATGVPATGGTGTVATPWSTYENGLLTSQSGQLQGDFTGYTGVGLGEVFSGMTATPTVGAFQSGRSYNVVFTAMSNANSSVTDRLQVSAGGTFLLTSPTGTQVGANTLEVNNAALDGGAQTYFFRFLSNGSSSLSINGYMFTGLAGAGISAIAIDNIFIAEQVPEVNAKSAALPLTLMIGAMLMAYDSRRKTARMANCV